MISIYIQKMRMSRYFMDILWIIIRILRDYEIGATQSIPYDL